MCLGVAVSNKTLVVYFFLTVVVLDLHYTWAFKVFEMKEILDFRAMCVVGKSELIKGFMLSHGPTAVSGTNELVTGQNTSNMNVATRQYWVSSQLFKLSAQTSYTISIVCAKFCHNSVWISECYRGFDHRPLDLSSSLNLNVKGPGIKRGGGGSMFVLSQAHPSNFIQS